MQSKSAYHILPLLLLGGTAFAAPPTAATGGALLQQAESRRQLPGLAEKPQPTRSEPEELLPPVGATVTVREFKFSGNTLLSSELLAEMIAPMKGQPLDFEGLKKAVRTVADAYRSKGWVVRAYLPKQDVTKGVVLITVVEGHFGKVAVAGNPPFRLRPSIVDSIVKAAQAPGKPVNADAIDRAVLVLGDLPGLDAFGSLAEGTAPGETDLLVRFDERSLFSGTLTIDNAGPRSTGSARALADFFANSPLKIGDELALNLIASEGMEYGRLAYTVPLGYDSLRVGASASFLNYDLVAPELRALNAQGSDSTFGLNASYSLVRSQSRNLYLSLSADRKNFDNQAGDTTITNYSTNSVTTALSGNLFDSFAGGGVSAASLAWTTGRVDLDGSPNKDADAATLSTQGDFNKLRFSLSRQQVLSDSLNLAVAFTGQVAEKNLDSSERFYLGGLYGVRAYPVNEASGSSGLMLNTELTQRLPWDFAASAFYDWGQVLVNQHNDFPGATSINRYDLQGGGLGLLWGGMEHLTLKAEWARRSGSNPNPTPAGSDQDGSLKENRFWLSASYSF